MTTTSLTPTVDLIRRRLRVKIDGTGDASARAVNGRGQRTLYTARRGSTTSFALKWVAIGYRDVQVRFSTARNKEWRDFPATREEAVQAVRELAALQGVGTAQWRRFLKRIEALP